MNKKKISYLVLSDIHLGNNNNQTSNIVDNLRYYFKTNHNTFKNLDIIFIAGDLFDKLLVNYSPEYLLITEWIAELVLYCRQFNIKLRVLEGTPSHDWKQAKAISTTIDKLNTDIDYNYVQTLRIEYMEDLGLHVLYVPDEYNHKASDTYKEVLELLASYNIDKVDIAIMHGQFHYQLPILLESSHTEEEYLNITKYYINIGHIHISSVNSRILAQGSFDRIAHNEESDKGGMLIDIYNTGDMEFRFIKNTKAKIFKTMDLTTLVIEDMNDYLEKELLRLPVNSNVRLIVDRERNLKSIIAPIKEKYKGYTIKVEYNKPKEESNKNVLEDIVITSFSIDKGNIVKLLEEELEQYNLTKQQKDIFKEEISMVI